MKMNKEAIEQLQKQLNRSGLLPESYYRRNHIHYPLICYVNNLTGLYLSSNYEGIPLFVNRAYDHLRKTKEKPLSEIYANLVMEYLSQIAKLVLSTESVSDSAKKLIPSDFS
jgi:hypothetical protein